MKVERFIERIEGEAILLLDKEADGSIRDVEILFPHMRGMEKFLERKPALDALAMTPRVCGICGHAHLIATARALEACYAHAGISVPVSAKAETLRSLTLALEMVQNHFKWFYLTLLPSVPKMAYRRDPSVLAAHRAASLCARAIAHIAGQWPHTSYALPGGVMCDPTHVEILQVGALLAQVAELFEATLLRLPLEEAAEMEKTEALMEAEGDLPDLLRHFRAHGWERLGQSHDRFIVLADHLLGRSGKSIRTRLATVDATLVEEGAPSAPKGYVNHARPVRYNGRYYETGPLARAMVARSPLIRHLHRRYKDATITRIAARVMEIARLLDACMCQVETLDLSEPSYVAPPEPLEAIEFGRGEGCVEAARGSLVHRVHLYRGKIARYCIVTPTQWNLAGGTPEEPGVAQRAMIGLPDEAIAETVFRSFDICSVCTTQ
jgi:Ni,Fe-hydrogenase I large subunit